MKKPVTMKFNPDDLAKIDAKAKALKITRTDLFTLAALAYVSHPKRAPSDVGEKIVDTVAPRAKSAPVDEFGDAPKGWRRIDPPGSRLKQPKKGK